MPLPWPLVRAIVAAMWRAVLGSEDLKRDIIKYGETEARARHSRISKLRVLSMAWACAIDDEAHARNICAWPVDLVVPQRTGPIIGRILVHPGNNPTRAGKNIQYYSSFGIAHFDFDNDDGFKTEYFNAIEPYLLNAHTLYFANDFCGTRYHYSRMLWLLAAAPNLRVLHIGIYDGDNYDDDDDAVADADDGDGSNNGSDINALRAIEKKIETAIVALPRLRMLNLKWSRLNGNTRAALRERFGEKVKFE